MVYVMFRSNDMRNEFAQIHAVNEKKEHITVRVI